ncbi:Maf1 regulator [Melghirimyces profundicolus]|uniref:Maf1 regulator n=1 Tax=Melghirimyces profundicolus TaxID=1242148 RepID=A0A2T6BU60_9BACL|nr:hypothetical protein [Melghirimyces profundicolus]PTX59594.1 Maf1 regulator [Melghirimyces profundicolus]
MEITPNPFHTENTRKQIVDLVNTYAKEYVKAHKSLNADLYTTVTDNIKKEEAEGFSYEKKYGNDEPYKGKALGTRIDFAYYKFQKNEQTDRFEAMIPIELHRQEVDTGFFSDGEMQDNYHEYSVTLAYYEDKKKWLITSLEPGYSDVTGTFGNKDVMEGKDVVKSTFK